MATKKIPHEQSPEMYTLVGVGMSKWAMVEGRLYALYEYIIKPGNMIASSAAFFSITSFRAKLLMVDNAIHAINRHNHDGSFKKTFDDWGEVHKKLRDVNGQRNLLAHLIQTMHTKQTQKDGQTTKSKTRLVLMPHAINYKEGLFDKPTYTIHDVRRHVSNIEGEFDRLGKFMSDHFGAEHLVD